MASLICRKCGAEERDTRGDCLPCKRRRRKLEYDRKVGNKPHAFIPPADLGFRVIEAKPDSAEKQAARAAFWLRYLEQKYFGEDAGMSTAELEAFAAQPDAVKVAFRAASDAQHKAAQRAKFFNR